MKNSFKVIGFDADDTLWVNEPYFRASEKEFCALLKDFKSPDEVAKVLFVNEVRNLTLYGYGVKAFMLSMIETALELSENKLPGTIVSAIIALGRKQLNHEVVVLDGIAEALQQLHQKGQRMVLITKGDLLDQERKLSRSGLDQFFHHVEVMSEKHEENYLHLLEFLQVEPCDFLMIGNSIKSDILPVLNIGGYGIHIPFYEIWEHEITHEKINNPRFFEVNHISGIYPLLGL